MKMLHSTLGMLAFLLCFPSSTLAQLRVDIKCDKLLLETQTHTTT